MTKREYDRREYRRNRKRLLEDRPPCVRCGAPATTANHRIPIKAGGTSALSNLEPMCGPCNSSIGARRRTSYVAKW